MPISPNNPRLVTVVVLVDDQHRNRIHEVGERLRAAGLNVVRVSGTIGVIEGTIREDWVDKLRAVAGVASVKVSGVVRPMRP